VVKDDDLAEILKENLAYAFKQMKTKIMQWLCNYLLFPRLIFALGGSNGAAFAAAFVTCPAVAPFLPSTVTDAMRDRQLLQSKEVEMFKGWISTAAKKQTPFKNVNTLGLLERLVDPEFAQEFVVFATGKHYLWHGKLPQLTDFIRLNILYVFIHQMDMEGMFNKFDRWTHRNMKMDTARAVLVTRELEDSQFKATFTNSDFKAKMSEIKARPNDYGTIEQILADINPLLAKPLEIPVAKPKKPKKSKKTETIKSLDVVRIPGKDEAKEASEEEEDD
jgi:hypothetical protein